MAEANAAAESAALKSYTKDSANRHFGYAAITGVGTLLSILGGPIGALAGYVMIAGATAKRAYDGLRNIGYATQKKYKEKRNGFSLAGVWKGIKAAATYFTPYATTAWDGILGAIEYNRDKPLSPLDYELNKYREAVRQAEEAAAAQQDSSEENQ